MSMIAKELTKKSWSLRPLLLALLLSVSQACFAEVGITGRVFSESGQALPGVTVRVGEAAAQTDPAGRFAIEAAANDIYLLNYSAANHFPMIHAYSPLELTWLKSGPGGAAEVPDVTLVERVENRVMLAFGGDAMMGRRFSEPNEGEPQLIREGHEAEDTTALLRHMKPYLEVADLTSINLETQVMASRPEQQSPKSYVFYTPPEALQALKVSGVDYVTLGNNHTYDYLQDGLASTLDALNASGLGWSGAGLTESQSLQAYRTEISGNPMSFLGFLGWAGNFTPNQVAQGDQKGGAAFGTSTNIGFAVQSEARQGYLPVVQYHGSREYTDEPTLVTETRLKQAIDDGAVLAIAHHPHVVQGFEVYNGRLIAYSMGNFIFDQFHYATKRSFLLYTWLNGDRLHRAEVMPLRIKGYTPMPATDTFRLSVLRRVFDLSSRRGVELQASGGNAVILPQPRQTGSPPLTFTPPPLNFSEKNTVWRLTETGWNRPVEAISMEADVNRKILLGQDLLPMGHLESHFLHDAPDMSWIEDGSQAVVQRNDAPSGRNVMQLTVPAGQQEGTIGMRTFEYTFKPGTPTSFVVSARSSGPAVVTAYQQWRKRDENRLEALATAQLRPIGQKELAPGGWQELRFDFNSPRVTAISYRVVLKITPADPSTDFYGWFDDIGLIEWVSPPLGNGPVPASVANKQASHAGTARREGL
jgi:poly-gamma-glutamate capsule biosynthesis protein CapA/YwtB (metallophosphatase superfamily)